MSIELRQLAYFVAVAEEMHFGRAAKRLHMTQPPLSQAIQQLEQHLAVRLFERSTRHTQLTAAGIALLPEAQRLLKQAQELKQLVRHAAEGKTGELKLAFVSIADYSVLPPCIRRFNLDFPQVQLQLQEATSDQQLAALERGDIDLGLLIPPVPHQLQNIIEYRPLQHERLMLALPEPHVKRKNKNQLATYQDLPFILFPRKIAPALHDRILACFHEQGLTPKISQEAIQMQTIIALVSAQLGYALVPASMSNLKRDGVVYLPLKPAGAQLEIGAAWRKDNRSPVLQAFLKFL